MNTEFMVMITETKTRPVWVTAEDPLEAQRIAEEDYTHRGAGEIIDVSFEVDPTSRRYLWERERGCDE